MTTTALGFTSNFINRLTESRNQLERYVESNKRIADDHVTALRTIQVNEQQTIDNLQRQLKLLQYERGVVAATGEAAGVDDGGLAEQRKKLDKRQVLLEDELTLLKTKNHIEQTQLDGTCILVFFIVWGIM
jgi:predicted deacetylase